MSDHESAIARYRIDAGRSKFTVQAFATGLLAGFGHNPVIAIRDFTGEAQFTPETIADAALRLVIKAASLAVVGDVKEKDRQEIERVMLDDVLEVARYPEVVFESTSVTATRSAAGRYRVRLVGDLTLHDVTRQNIWIAAQLTLGEADLRAQGDFTIKPTDYRIKLVSVAAGALKLKDELQFSFDLAGEHTDETDATDRHGSIRGNP